MELLILLLLLVAVTLILSRRKRVQIGTPSRGEITGHGPAIRYMGTSGAGLSITLDGNLVALWGNGRRLTLCVPSDIVRAEILRNDIVVHDTSGMAGAGLGGALLLGPMGGLMALTGQAKSSKNIQELALKIYVRDIERPYHKVTFLKSRKGVPTSFSKAARAATALEEWNSRLAAVMTQRAAS